MQVDGNDDDIREVSGCSPLSSGTSSIGSLEQLLSDTSVARFINLPWICVMGETSSGKSAVLSQLSGIPLPSHHTLTTRCPTLILLQQGEVRKVRLQSVCWKESNETLPLSDPRMITSEDWDQIPSAILEAQESLLNEKGGVRTDCWVKMEVSGPQFTNHLTLVDLPGLVQNTADEDMRSKIDALWKSVNHPRSILLAVHPATSDFHNAAVWNDVTSHCIPVLTKPDLIDPGAEPAIVDLLTGQHSLPLQGFHLIKCRGQAALEDSIEKALDDEKEFFNMTEPWKSLSDRSCLGTLALRDKLIQMQLNLWRDTLPDILETVRTTRDDAAKKVALFQPVLDRRRYFHERSQKLLSHLTLSFRGRSSPSAASQLHQACSLFAERVRHGSLATIRTILEGALVVVTTPRGTVRGEVVHLDRDFCCVDFVQDEDRQSEALFDRVGMTLRDSPHVNVDDVWTDGNKVFVARPDRTCDSLRRIPLRNVRTDPSWLKDKIAQNRTGELACFLNVDIFESVVADFIDADWKPPCDQLVQETDKIVREAMRGAITAALAEGVGDRYPDLRSLLQRHCTTVVNSLLDAAREQVETHLIAEKQPYTLDLVLLENITEARHRSLRRELELALRLDTEPPPQQGNSGIVYDAPAIQAIMDTVFERQKLKTVEDTMAEEMEIILESYGRIATRRVIDRSPMICWEVLRSLVPAIQQSLLSISEDELLKCMQDSEENQTLYEQAQKVMDEMNRTLEILRSV